MRPATRNAYVALLDHAVACPTCRAGAALCPDGQHLADALNAARTVICYRCDRPITPGEPRERHVHDRATGAPLVLYVHRAPCTGRRQRSPQG
ncbi:hypothetical protein [Streptomyces apocyni]|uniref:hypothetical protein n=1 Tax=Streptomyces apocyni TaxID=2654677 RepID=UPI0012EA00A8|nr:hypothetical protein [Streptomyces apocyni]